MSLMASEAFIQCRVPQATKEALRAAADRQQLTESALLKRMLGLVLHTSGAPEAGEVSFANRPSRKARLYVRLTMGDRQLLGAFCCPLLSTGDLCLHLAPGPPARPYAIAGGGAARNPTVDPRTRRDRPKPQPDGASNASRRDGRRGKPGGTAESPQCLCRAAQSHSLIHPHQSLELEFRRCHVAGLE